LIDVPTVFEDSYATAQSVPFSDERAGFAGPVTVVREPYGVAVTILTYNGPLAYTGMKVLPALLSGNVVILKLPSETRLVAQYIAAAAEEAELPPGVLSVLAAGAASSKYLVEHPGVDVVSFTGGTAVGSQILHSTADRIVKTTLELGGKSAGIVAGNMPTEDLLPALLPGLLPGLLPFQGQVCVALTRLLVPAGRRDEIVSALTGVFSSLRIGDALDPGSDFGPVAVSRTRDRCEDFVASAVSEGATVAYGGRRPAGLDPGIDEAVAIANDSPYGLTGAIFTHDGDLALSVGRRLRVGSFTVNSTGGVLGQPFGGYKRSGLGREMGLEGFREWTQTKSIQLAPTMNYLG
jgi:acyl-CoA reductase-like NAD-dependent aldehyde dehydrogenase